MVKKFLEGLAFGGGFTLSFLAISYLVAFFAMPILLSKGIPLDETSHVETSREPGTGRASPNFHELTVEDQIKEASVIALVGYELSADGKATAVISEFLKKEPGVEFRYAIGDEYPPASHYVSEGSGRGDGQILFFVGSPAEMRMSSAYSGDRIRGLGDIPLQLFREKCSAEDT